MTLFSPSDLKLTEKFVDYSIRIKKPKYLRLDGKPLPQIYDSIKDSEFQNGFKELVKGEKICLVSTGYMSHKALRVANLLNERQIRVGVIDLFMLKPLNEELFSETINPYDYVVTLEEAFINKGGLDSLVTNILTRRNSKFRIKRMGFEDTYIFDMGSREHLHKLNNLDEESIIKVIEEYR
jgi:transketolase